MGLLDYRRQARALYDEVRACSEPSDGHRLWREGRERLFLEHPESPGQPGQRLEHAPYDPAWRFVVGLEEATPERLEVQTGTDGTAQFDRIGRVSLPGVGALDVWWLASYGGGLFVPVKDASCGVTTYGGGRYVLDTAKGADLGGDADGLVVDLNFAYNPSCAYDPAWACPLPPLGNLVDADIRAGELAPQQG